MRVADPDDELYGRYETPEVQSARLVPADRRQRVTNWLRSELVSCANARLRHAPTPPTRSPPRADDRWRRARSRTRASRNADERAN